MAESRMLTVFCYDVSDDGVRRRVASVLEDAAVRVQGSVFEAWMSAPEAARVARVVARHLEDGDSLRVYAVGAEGLRRSRAYGPPPLLPRDGHLMV
ncbi:CRISPR-associated endonuclease Cas2 [Roseospirillum parvum]|uniref:CRISPR-associated endoribonuclease Cas2 n=1 Tax=Roseospirillum parvum TaxID=83401 RepID=A0A1G8FCR9_9PROT|nr:CRISPR-associated endonuclease Cas2 [Roseospirillum parvum]SDH79832.1 CRISPR-associated protein Cas2 [Roseospirillum parvum]